MNASLIGLLALCVSIISFALNYHRDVNNDKQSEKEKDKESISTLIKSSMTQITDQLNELKSDLKDVKKEVNQSTVSIGRFEERFDTLFKNYRKLDGIVTDLTERVARLETIIDKEKEGDNHGKDG